MPRQKASPSGSKPTKLEREISSWKRLETAAKKFKGLDPQLRAKQELRHISRTQSGYQVRIHREGKYVVNECVLGHSEESLEEAVRLRDEALPQWPTARPRTNRIPARVLKALGLSEPVIGICRLESRSVYRIVCPREGGRSQMRQFYYRVVPEEVAYAAAIAFLQSLRK